MRRAPISAPAPGPNGRMKRTGCCGQAWVWASAGGVDKVRIAKRETTRTQSFDIFQVLMRGMTAGRQSDFTTSVDDRATISVCSLSPLGERVGVRGLQNYREIVTPHPTPLPMGEWIDMQRQKILVLLQLFMLTPSPSSCRRLHVGSISAPRGSCGRALPL